MKQKHDMKKPTAMMRNAGQVPFPKQGKSAGIKKEDAFYETFGAEEISNFHRILSGVFDFITRSWNKIRSLNRSSKKQDNQNCSSASSR